MNHIKNIFTNSGIRHTVEHELLQPKAMNALGYAIATILSQEFDYVCNILIATDTRLSGQNIKENLTNAFIECGHDVFDAGIVPTPFVAKALKDFQPDTDQDSNIDESDQDPFFTLGIIVTASHNPANFNGIKILTPFGYLDENIEQEITALFFKFYTNNNLKNNAQADELGYSESVDLVSWYQAIIADQISMIATPVSVLLDCANGAASSIAAQIFQSFGYQVHTIHNQGDGSKINLNSGCNNPQLLLEQLQKSTATWACAFDGDADRVMIVHRNGTIFDGDDIVAALAEHDRYKDNPVIVGTIMSNQGLEEYCKIQNKKLIRSDVGERNVINALIKHEAFLGAETCGHIIIIDHALCSDGIFAALQFLECMQNKTIQSILKKHSQQHKTIHVADKETIKKCSQFIALLQSRYQQEQSCRIIIRSSNTEPVLRIMVESSDPTCAVHVCNILHDQLKLKFLHE